MGKKINDNITWVGKTDWNIKKFHGNEYSTFKGTTYNSYLVRDEKTVLIDTVWKPYADEFIENLKQEIDLEDIDYIIANHAELDHSGSLPQLMELIPDKPIYCTQSGVQSLKGHYHKDWNFVPVETGKKISLGEKDLIFIEAMMLHWPDSMFCYLTGDNVLFSNDAFGQHYATEKLFNNLVDKCELYIEAIKYYANILTPFSRLVEQKIKELKGMDVPVDMICPSHGIIWRDDPMQIVNKYMDWAGDYQEDQVLILYDTMWDGTALLAEALKEGIQDKAEVKVMRVSTTDKNDIITEVFKSKIVLFGSPTVNAGILSSMAAILEQVKGMKFKNKKAVSFGCFGWSGESIDIINNSIKEAGLELINNGFSCLWEPDGDMLKRAKDFAAGLI
jgi:flavorubredoxin